MRTLLVLVLTLLMNTGTGSAIAGELPPGGTFVDDDGNTHEGYIEAIAAVGITRGCNPPFGDRFCPSDNVTRGQMAAFLVRALGLVDDGGKDWFIDDNGSGFEADINKLATAGITRGCNPPIRDRFCPTGFVTRGEMAAFLVRAYEYSDPGPSDWFPDDDGHLFEADINRLRTAGVTLGCRAEPDPLYCPNGLVKRDQMASFLGRAGGLTATIPPPRHQPVLKTVVSGLDQPVFLTSPAGDSRLFVVEKIGRIRIVTSDVLVATPFLDVTSLVAGGHEGGLLGMAFHPNYDSNGRFYISYTDTSGTSQIVEYTVSGDVNVADPLSARGILTVAQPHPNHNGGMILFDASGSLFFGLGDGGGGGDPLDRAEDPTSLLGSMLRIGVDGDDFPLDTVRNYTIPADNPFIGSSAGADEVWAYGLRNPWRFSLDEASGLIYIADVGQLLREEVNVAPISLGAVNYGWNTLEGTLCFQPATGCSSAGTRLPVAEYPHDDGCAIVGGYVYRGTDFPDLVGHYFYADYCRGVLQSFRYSGGVALSQRSWAAEFGSVGNVNSFGVDSINRLYILTDGGSVIRLVPSV